MRDHLDPAGTNATAIDGIGNCGLTAGPATVTVTPNGDNRIDLSWSAVAGAERYRVFRSRAVCPGGNFEQLGEVTGTTFSDLTASGGITYAYRVSAVDDQESCESPRSNCQAGSTTGACRIPPNFAGVTAAQNAQSASCAVNLTWTAATNECAAATSTVYNVYRGTSPTFAPSSANRIASCLTGTSFSDSTAQPATAYHYIVRSEDDLSGGAGQCRNGNEDLNLVSRQATATGPDTEIFSDPASSTANWSVDGTGAGSDFSLVTTSVRSAPTAFFSPNASTQSDRRLVYSQPIAIPSNAAGYTLEFWHRFFLEANWDGGVLEYSLDGGSSWADILAANGPVPANANRFMTGGYTGPLSITTPPTPPNPLEGRAAWSGGATGLPYSRVAVNMADFAGQTVQLRWRLGTDRSVAREGWWIDDVRLFAPTACAAGNSDNVFTNGFEG
jgi:hypothetical protein